MTRRRRSGPTWEPSHAELVALAVTWARASRLRCSVVLAEPGSMRVARIPDVLAFGPSGSVQIEAKASRADFRADAKKAHRHPELELGDRRFFFVPEGLIDPEEVPEPWGLAWVAPSGRVRVVRDATQPPPRTTTALRDELALVVSALRRWERGCAFSPEAGRFGPWDRPLPEDRRQVVTRDELHRLEGRARPDARGQLQLFGRASSSAEAWGPPDPEELDDPCVAGDR